MKNIKYLFVILTTLIFIPLNIIAAESFDLENHVDDNGKTFVIPSGLPILDSCDLNVIEEEEIINNYFIDKNDKSYNLYTVTLEFLGDGTDANFVGVKSILEDGSHDNLNYSYDSIVSSESYKIDGESYTPIIDLINVTTGDILNFKDINGVEYDDLVSEYSIVIQYQFSKYKNSEELNKCIESNDSNEELMRKGYLLITIIYPSDSDIQDYLINNIDNKDKTFLIDTNSIINNLSNSFINILGDGYSIENFDEFVVITKYNNQVIKIYEQDDNIRVSFLGDYINEEEIFETLIESSTNIVKNNDGSYVDIIDEDNFVVFSNDGDELLTINKIDNREYSICFNYSKIKNLLAESEAVMDQSESIKNETRLSILPIVEALSLFVIIVILITIIIKISFKKKK